MEYLIGLDVGTTAVKAGLFGTDGSEAGCASREYDLLTPGPDLVELPVATYWDSCVQAVREAVKRSGIAATAIRGMAISSQGETLIPIAADGTALRNAIVWLDNRSARQAQALSQVFERSELYRTTGQTEMVPTWPATKILWLRENEPEVFSAAAKYLLLEDWLLHLMTGKFVEEHSLASSTTYFDIVRLRWWEPMLEAVGLSEARLPELLPPGTPVGKLTSDAAEALGLATDVVVSTGALDQLAGAVGAGNARPGDATETTGAALAICATVERPTYDPLRNMPCHCHAVPGLYAMLPWCQTAGMALRWFRDVFGGEEVDRASREGTDPYDLLCALAESVPAGSDGLIMLPHLAGAFCPEMLPQARGVYFGFTLGHRKGHFVRATMESVAFMLRRNLDSLDRMGTSVGEIRSLGGASRSNLWNQIKADVCGRRVTTLVNTEAACLGAAILAGAGAGVYTDIREASQEHARPLRRYDPSVEMNCALSRNYEKYCELFDALTGLF